MTQIYCTALDLVSHANKARLLTQLAGMVMTGELLVGFLSLENLSGNHFNTAYQLTKIACQENSILAMYWQQIDKLFQSDPRFNP